MKKFDNSSLNPNLKLEIHCRCAERVRDELFRKVVIQLQQEQNAGIHCVHL